MRYLLPIGLLLVCGCAGTFTTESQKMNAAAVTDQAEAFNQNGATANSPETQQHLKNAQTNELVVGPPKKRIPVADLEDQEKNRTVAESQVKSTNWRKIVYGVLSAASILTGMFGIPIGGFIDRLRSRVQPV